MIAKRISGFLCAALLLGVLAPGVYGAEEAALAGDDAASEELVQSLEGTESASAPEVTAEPAPDREPEPEPEPTAEPEPLSEIILYDDPETPDFGTVTAPRLGASGEDYSRFRTRALDHETLHRGIDVSAWQKTIDWGRVAAAGVEFVIIRAAYRGSLTGALAKDGRFDEYIRGAKAAGLKVGAYIFSQAITPEEGAAEADYIAGVVRGWDIDLPLVIDFEFYDGGRLQTANLSRRQGTDICNAFCARAEQYGYDSMVYANPYMLNHYLYPTELGRLWLAHYTTSTGYSASKYEYWQCSGSGAVDGVSGDVDLDFWFEPEKAVSTPTPAPTSDDPFSDVRAGDWFYDVVTTAYKAEIVNGVTETEFRPNATATRGQVVTMLYRMLDCPAWKSAALFEDLSYDYYKGAIYWAAENGVVEGYSQTEFRPDKAITRQELVTILYRLEEPEESRAADLEGYTDADRVQSWAVPAMRWAAGVGIVGGYEDGTLRPRANATRAEVCAILLRYAAYAYEQMST